MTDFGGDAGFFILQVRKCTQKEEVYVRRSLSAWDC